MSAIMSALVYNPTRQFIRLIALTLLVGVTFGALGNPAGAQQTKDDILQILEQRDKDIKTLVGEHEKLPADIKEQLRSVINDVIDFRSMGQEALGRHWDRLTDEQKLEFVDTFSKIVRSQSLASLDVYRANVSYDEITVDGMDAHVITTTTYKDVPTKVEYKLHYNGDTWVATDILLDRVSTVEGYSRSFQSVIRKKGFDELMVKLREKLADVESSVS